jgi:hypothetical protein
MFLIQNSKNLKKYIKTSFNLKNVSFATLVEYVVIDGVLKIERQVRYQNLTNLKYAYFDAFAESSRIHFDDYASRFHMLAHRVLKGHSGTDVEKLDFLDEHVFRFVTKEEFSTGNYVFDIDRSVNLMYQDRFDVYTNFKDHYKDIDIFGNSTIFDILMKNPPEVIIDLGQYDDFKQDSYIYYKLVDLTDSILPPDAITLPGGLHVFVIPLALKAFMMQETEVIVALAYVDLMHMISIDVVGYINSLKNVLGNIIPDGLVDESNNVNTDSANNMYNNNNGSASDSDSSTDSASDSDSSTGSVSLNAFNSSSKISSGASNISGNIVFKGLVIGCFCVIFFFCK